MSDQGRRFYLTDVFGRRKYTGNQLATVVDCDGLSVIEMQQIAREINFSETTFVSRRASDSAQFDVRIFTPAAEVPFAGHPVLGSAWVIREKILQQPLASLVLNLPIGPIDVRFSDGVVEADNLVWMRQAALRIGETGSPAVMAAALGIDAVEISNSFPVLEASTGFPHWIVPLNNMQALQAIRVDRNAALKLVESTWAKNILAFAPSQRPGHSLAVRVFADYYGVAEDAATGSGNGALAAYLATTRFFGDANIDTVVGQGYEMGRPSELHLRATRIDNVIDVEIGGHVVGVAEGVWSG